MMLQNRKNKQRNPPTQLRLRTKRQQQRLQRKLKSQPRPSQRRLPRPERSPKRSQNLQKASPRRLKRARTRSRSKPSTTRESSRTHPRQCRSRLPMLQPVQHLIKGLLRRQNKRLVEMSPLAKLQKSLKDKRNLRKKSPSQRKSRTRILQKKKRSPRKRLLQKRRSQQNKPPPTNPPRKRARSPKHQLKSKTNLLKGNQRVPHLPLGPRLQKRPSRTQPKIRRTPNLRKKPNPPTTTRKWRERPRSPPKTLNSHQLVVRRKPPTMRRSQPLLTLQSRRAPMLQLATRSPRMHEDRPQIKLRVPATASDSAFPVVDVYPCASSISTTTILQIL